MLITDELLHKGVHDESYIKEITVEVELLIDQRTGEINNSRIVGSSLYEAVETKRQEILESP